MVGRFNFKIMISSFIVISVITFSMLLFVELESLNNNSISLNLEEELAVSGVYDVIQNDIKGIASDLIFIRDTTERTMNDQDESDIELVFFDFATSKGIYDQLRYIDYHGDEIVRINYNYGNVKSVDTSELQNKADRYYVEDTINLKYGSIYISKLDLNMEDGQIEQPYKPMIRFVTPLKNKNGIIVLNYLAENIIEDIDNYNKSNKGQIYLLNDEGYYLYSGSQFTDFGFMFNDDKSIYNMDELEKTEGDNIGQFINESGMRTFKQIALNINLENPIIQPESEWWIVSLILKDSEYGDLITTNIWSVMGRIIKVNIGLIFVILMIAMIISYLFKRNEEHVKNLKHKSEYDEMTGILNRRSGIEKIELLKEKGNEFTLVFIDIDGLKKVNDVQGHHLGDELIITFVKCVKECIRIGDVFARVGGDEFILAVNSISTDVTTSICQRISNQVEQVNSTNDLSYVVGFSYGSIIVDRHLKQSLDEIIRNADEKMYESKMKKKQNL